MSEKARVVAVRCADLPRPAVDSAVRVCFQCHEPVWVSPGTLQAEARFDVSYACQVCQPPEDVVRRVAADRSRLGVLPGQREELERLFGTWGATLLLSEIGAQEVDDQ